MISTIASSLPALKLGDKTARYPVVQGGMGVRISGANLAAAVANAGGVGIISSVGLGLSSPHLDSARLQGRPLASRFSEASRLALLEEIQAARALSPQGIIGINTMVADRNHEALMAAIVDQPIDLVIAGAGLPLALPRLLAQAPHIALVPIVSSLRAARIICRKWSQQCDRLPDGFVVEHPRYAGGHLGAKADELEAEATSLEVLIPQLATYLAAEMQADIPIIAAGGVWDRSDIDQMLALGASGVQIGTRFITTDECDAHERYKTFHLQAQPEDVTLVPSPVGMPGRALKNAFAEKILSQHVVAKTPCVNCLHHCRYRDQRETYCILNALDRAAKGDVENGLIFSGTNAGRSDRLYKVEELMRELVRG
jgi:nitronate monooxygenase